MKKFTLGVVLGFLAVSLFAQTIGDFDIQGSI
jgi:hypothetical protein